MFRRLDGSDGKTRFQDIETDKVYNDLPDGGEIETQADVLDRLLEKVDLNSPLLVTDGLGNQLAIPREKFIKYYLPKDATPEEAYHCFNQTKAAGLSPLIAGECHYPRFGDAPLRLFTGYPVYLRKAYQHGLIHLEVEFELDDNGKVISVITTFDIQGREKPFVWQTWYSEVEGQTKGQTNWRWRKAPKSQTRKCGVVDGIRYSGLLIDDPLGNVPIMEEYPEPPAEGHKTLTQEQLDTLGVEEDKAEPGKVTATLHQIDLSPLMRNYRGKIVEREIFVDDTQRKMWQSEIIGKASTADWDAMDFNNATSEIESGRCAQWVQDNKPQTDPDKPTGDGGNDQAGQSEHGWADQAAMEMENVNGHLPLDDNQPKTDPDKPSSGDDFLENSPDVPPKQTFLDEGKKRFVNSAELEKWCYNKVSEIPVSDWKDDNFVIALSALMKLPLLDAESDTDATAQGDTPSETTEGQEPASGKLSRATREAIKEALVEFDDYRYQKIGSQSYKLRAGEVLGRDEGEMVGISDLNEAEGVVVLESLKAERQEQLEKIAEVKKFKADLTAGEVVDDDPLDQGEPTKREPAATEEPADGKCTNEEYQELKTLFAKLFPEKEYAIGSAVAHDFVRDQIGHFDGMKALTTNEVNDVRLAMMDELGEPKADD